jgi:hypothetical protein
MPASGFLKQYVVEINDDGYVAALYPLEEEIESIIWTPGVIRLISHDCLTENQILTFDKTEIATTKLIAIRLYPFDFSEMKANADTTIQVLTHSNY